MSTIDKTPLILVIDSADDAVVRETLERELGVAVKHVMPQKTTSSLIRRYEPKLIVLNVNVTNPTAETLLSTFAARSISTPVVLMGANGETASTNFEYPHITGWISHPFTPGELARLIQNALKQPPLDSELVLAKRAELIDANRRLANRVQELQTLFEIGKSIAAELDLEAVLRLVVDAAVNFTAADESYLFLVDERQRNFYLRAETNFNPEAIEIFSNAISNLVARRILQTGQPVIFFGGKENPELVFELDLFALLAVPVRIGAQIIGVLGVNNRRQKRSFHSDDQKLLAALADWSAIAIQNARLYQSIRQSSRDLELAYELSHLVSSTLDAQEIPRLLLKRTAEIIGAACGSLALIDREAGQVVFQLAYDHHGNEIKGLRNFFMPLGEGIVGLVAQTGQPVIANNVKEHPAWSSLSDQMTGFVTKKLVAVPLISEGEVLGVIELLNKRDTDFEQSDVDLLALVASSAASAIRNANRFAALQQSNRALHAAHEQRIAAERWAVLGKAAANLAHRINNTTAIIPIAAGHTRELIEQLDLPPELETDIDNNLDRIKRNALYTVELARVLLRRFQKHPADAHDVNELVGKALEVVEIPDNVKVVRHLDPDLPAVDTSDLLIDVFVELINNALRAMANKEGLLRIATFKGGKQSVSIQVTDNGPGIPAENLNKIFDMFYTTHSNGLGFGLWWVKSFLEQQHGDITVESQPGENTTFTITLPQNLPSLRTSQK